MFRILHVDTGTEWRGGQRQALLLHEELLNRRYESYLAAYEKSALFRRCSQNVLPLPSRSEFSWKSLLQLRRYIRQLRPHIVHTHDARSLTLALLASYFSPSFTLINTRRVDFPAIKNIFSHWKYHHKRLTKIITVSDAIRRILIGEGIPENKIEVIYSGIEAVNPDDFSCPDEFIEIKNKASVIFGCVASFADHKDHLTLLNAFELVYRQLPTAYLILVGDGELQEKVRSYANQIECRKNVIFTGFRKDVFNIYKCFDIFIITSKEEGLCTALLDAMQFGLPIVATRAGGIPEIVHHEKNGLLGNIKDPEDIAQKMLLLASNENLRTQLGHIGKEMVKKFFYHNMVSQYVSLYEGFFKHYQW